MSRSVFGHTVFQVISVVVVLSLLVVSATKAAAMNSPQPPDNLPPVGNLPSRPSTLLSQKTLYSNPILTNATNTGSSVDVYMLVDLTGSFYDDLPIFKAQAPEIIADLQASNPNTRFGLGKFEDYPIFPFGDASYGDKAYERLVDLTFDTDLVLDTINGLFTRNGLDWPESQLPALYQAATGAGQDLSGVGYPGASIPPGQQANFRDRATKIFLLWTDAPFHYPGDPGNIPYPGPSFDETVDAILALDPPMVIGISSGGGGYSDLAAMARATNALAPRGGVDCDGDGAIDLAEGEPLVCTISYSGAGIAEAIVALVEAASTLPIADAGGPYTGTVGEAITFDGSGSYDPDGTIVNYEWDFESDGVFDDASPNPTTTHVYASGFSGNATLRVTDNDGNTASDVAQVTIMGVGQPDLAVSKTSDPHPAVKRGASLNYTISVANINAGNAPDVMVMDTLPAGVSPTGVVEIPLGAIAAGATVDTTLNVVVNGDTVGLITNLVTVSTSVPESNYDNNSASLVTMVTDNRECTRLVPYWAYQFGPPEPSRNFDEATLAAFLEITNYASTVFSEVTPVSTLQEAYDLLWIQRPTVRQEARQRALAAWLNFSSGAIGWDELVDTGKDGVPDTPFYEVMAEIEAILADPDATVTQIKRASLLAMAINSHDKGNPLCPE